MTKDGRGLGGFKGFRSARCNAPMREGKWYLEVKIELGGGDQAPDAQSREGSHVRLGWGRREAPLNGPVGLDGYSYGVRDKTGEKVTLSRPRPYGKPFKTGDVVGMYISLPPRRQPSKKDPHDPAHIHRERIPIDLKGQEVFEILEYPAAKEMSALMEHSTKATNSESLPSTTTKKPATGVKAPERAPAPLADKNPKVNNAAPLRPLPILEGSRIAFFVNGECQGIAFEDIYDFLPLRQTDNQRKGKGRRMKEGVKEHRENPFDDGTLGYYPMISVFNDAAVKINAGPDFDFPPPRDIDALLEGRPQPPLEEPVKQEPESTTVDMDVDGEVKSVPTTTGTTGPYWRPAAERYPEFMEEQWALDKLEEDEAKVEFDKQRAKEEAGAKTKAAKGRAAGKKAAATKGAAASRKKKSAATTEQSSMAGTPAPEDAAGPSTATSKSSSAQSRKKAKKAEAQSALGVGSGQVVATEASTPTRSESQTPAGTPPPSISSTAAAAAAASLHLHHHPVVRQDLSNRPSPSPLRHSTAYHEAGDEGSGTAAHQSQTDKDGALQAMSPSSSSAQAPPRSRAPPGSKEGRERAAAAVAASHQGFVPPLPTQHGRPPLPASTLQLQGPGVTGRLVPNQAPTGNLMSLASLATGGMPVPIATTVPASSLPVNPWASAGPTAASSGASSAPPLAQPVPISFQAQYRPIGGLRSGPPPNAFQDDVTDSRGGTVSAGGSEYGGGDNEEEDVEDEILAAAGASSGSERDHHPMEEEEDDDDEGRDRASVPAYDDRDFEEEGATTDGAESRRGDVDMESEDGGDVLAEGYRESGARLQSPD